MPKPELPHGSICPLCRVQLTQQELDSFSVGYNGCIIFFWRCYHACRPQKQLSISKPNFAIMLSLLSVFERFCVRISSANFANAKKAIALQLKADAVEMEDGPLADEADVEESEE